jgi:hypothetical protein
LQILDEAKTEAGLFDEDCGGAIAFGECNHDLACPRRLSNWRQFGSLVAAV